MQTDNYVIKSLELHLFFGRIMKEHSFFLKAGFTPANSSFSDKADIIEPIYYRVEKIRSEQIKEVALYYRTTSYYFRIKFDCTLDSFLFLNTFIKI